MNEPLLILSATAMTHQGCSRNDHQDTISIGGWIRSKPMRYPETILSPMDGPIICAVADGMGGNVSGQTASRYAIGRLVEAADFLFSEFDITNLLQQVNEGLYDQMSGDPKLRGMGTTVSGIIFVGQKAIIFNVGDSRVYVQIDGFLRQLSVDDTRNAAVNPGLARLEADAIQRRSAKLTQAIGGGEERLRISPHCISQALEAGQRYLVCSDGVTDMISLDTIESCIGEDDPVSVNSIFNHVIRAGGVDNMSILLARVQKKELAPPRGQLKERF
jgi:serine/threonine protein phosphatase PrpC